VEYQSGMTDPGTPLSCDGKTIAIESRRHLPEPLMLKSGNQHVRDPWCGTRRGYTRAANLMITATDRDDKGGCGSSEANPNCCQIPAASAPLKDTFLLFPV